MLVSLGAPVVTAPGEAEAFCAALDRLVVVASLFFPLFLSFPLFFSPFPSLPGDTWFNTGAGTGFDCARKIPYFVNNFEFALVGLEAQVGQDSK